MIKTDFDALLPGECSYKPAFILNCMVTQMFLVTFIYILYFLNKIKWFFFQNCPDSKWKNSKNIDIYELKVFKYVLFSDDGCSDLKTLAGKCSIMNALVLVN